MSILFALIKAQQQVYAETMVHCLAARMNAVDFMKLREHAQFEPAAPNPTSWVGSVCGIEIKVDNGTSPGWVNLHGPGLHCWQLVRMDYGAPPPATAWSKIVGDDLV